MYLQVQNVFFFCILSLQDGVLLTKLITKYCPVEGINTTDLQVMKSLLFKSEEKPLFLVSGQIGRPC